MIAGIAGANYADWMKVGLFIVCCVSSGLCNELILRRGESYQLCMFVCDL